MTDRDLEDANDLRAIIKEIRRLSHRLDRNPKIFEMVDEAAITLEDALLLILESEGPYN